ncbi:hypothetical protein BE221DRAFT_78563 [Ostreococcus tauri]|uniref:Uncharacterized protein n=1 Tax=Ostreococcus tauri TaxID=70448 RepID=A0A1Y5I7W9_OSTTA|nr:hypothetical protein BE221DRAFT_78563 [Ostreococcus tauri]
MAAFFFCQRRSMAESDSPCVCKRSVIISLESRRIDRSPTLRRHARHSGVSSLAVVALALRADQP